MIIVKYHFIIRKVKNMLFKKLIDFKKNNKKFNNL